MSNENGDSVTFEVGAFALSPRTSIVARVLLCDGHECVDVRRFDRDSADELKPSNAGVTVAISHVHKLKRLVDDLEATCGLEEAQAQAAAEKAVAGAQLRC